eukprot:gene1700-1894_t
MAVAISQIVIIASVALLLQEEEQERMKTRSIRSMWTRPWLIRRKIYGSFHTLFVELKEGDPEGFKGYVRMDINHFDELVNLLAPFLPLGKEHFKTPKTTEEWVEIAEKFYRRWNFPNRLGGVDGKHIVLQQPKNSGSHYRNYKGSDSIILMGMIGPEYEFLFTDVGTNGRNSDGGNWSQGPLKFALESVTLNLPDATPLSGRLKRVPYVCTGDDAFHLSVFMMKPYPQKGLTSEKRVFNYRFSRMRRVSENGFGILANR